MTRLACGLLGPLALVDGKGSNITSVFSMEEVFRGGDHTTIEDPPCVTSKLFFDSGAREVFSEGLSQ